MNFESLAPVALGILLVTSLVLIASRDWRWTVTAMGVQYLGVFVLTGLHWPLALSVVKLVAGWMATAILAATQSSGLSGTIERTSPSGAIFRLMAGGLVILIVFSVSPEVNTWVPDVGQYPSLGGLLLMGSGVLLLGLTSNPLRVVLGLLMAFSGFEIYYAAVESATLVAGLLALVNLSLALVGAYMFEVSELEDAGASE